MALGWPRSADPKVALDRFPGDAPLLPARTAYGRRVRLILQRADLLENREVLGRDEGAEDFAATLDDDALALERDALENVGKLRPGLAGGEAGHLGGDVIRMLDGCRPAARTSLKTRAHRCRSRPTSGVPSLFSSNAGRGERRPLRRRTRVPDCHLTTCALTARAESCCPPGPALPPRARASSRRALNQLGE